MQGGGHEPRLRDGSGWLTARVSAPAILGVRPLPQRALAIRCASQSTNTRTRDDSWRACG